jgi:hypothetical protein
MSRAVMSEARVDRLDHLRPRRKKIFGAEPAAGQTRALASPSRR